jgi:large subunit ribosomal protein L13
MKTSVNTQTTSRNWFLIDATNLTLGRLATKVSLLLCGKTNPSYTPGVDNGNYVIIINAEKIKVSGKKESQKLYYRHSGRPGGLKIESFSNLLERFPEKIIEKSIRGMLPKTSLGRQYFRRLKVLKGSTHPFGKKEEITLIHL